MNRVLAITVSLVLVSFVLIIVVLLVSAQLSVFINTFPQLIDKFYIILNQAVIWASDHFNISTENINAYIEHTKTEMLGNSSATLGATLTTLGNISALMALIPVYVFMILFYEPLLLDFIRRLFGVENHKEVEEVLFSTK